MTIRDLQEHAKELARAFPEATVEQRTLFLTTEVGELVREVLALSGAYTSHRGVNREEAKQNLGMEMYDVIWNICDLANLLEIDLEQAFAAKIEINKTRKW